MGVSALGVKWSIALLLFGGWMIFEGIKDIREARQHTGPGIVVYEHRDEVVTEGRYKRHRVALGTVALMLGAASLIVAYRSTQRCS